jgi:hypothetical protein
LVAAQGSVSEDFSTTTYEAPATTAEGWGTGTISNPRDYTITQLDFVATASDGAVWSLDAQGRKVYLILHKTGTGTNALRVYNISDPTDIQFLDGQHPFTVGTSAAVDGDIMFVGNEGAVLRTYNVSDPFNIPSYIDSISYTTGVVTDIEVQGLFMYATVMGGAGPHFSIYDISDPTNAYRTDGSAWTEPLGVDVLGNLAYLADGQYGVYIRNVTDPYAEVSAGTFNTPGLALDCLADGSIVYVADGPNGVQVADCSTPSSSTIIDNYNTPGNASRLALQGNTLFVADDTSVQILDVSNPSNIVYVDQITLSGVHDVDVTDGGVLVIGTDAGLYTYRVGSMVTDFPLVKTYNAYDAYDVAFQGDIAYVAAGTDGLVILDVSNPANPTLLDRVWQGANYDYTTVDVEGQHAFVTNWGSSYKGMVCFDVSDPSNAFYTDYRSFTWPWDVKVSGDIAYVADGTAGLFTLNITNPYNIYSIDSEPLMDNASALAVQGHFAYVVGNGSTSGQYGQHNYNINDPSNILFTNGIQWSDAEDIVVSGDYAYIANGYSGINLADITDPWGIINSAYNSLPGTTYCTAIAVFGNYVFIGERGFGLRCVDAANIEYLTIISNYTTGNLDVRNLEIGGDYLYAACGSSLRIFRIFRSAGDTYQNPCLAESLSLYTSPTLILEATLTVTATTPAGTSIDWYLSADGGTNWESVTPGVAHTFAVPGIDLCWRANISNTNDDRTATISSVSIAYVAALPPPNLLPAIIAVIAVIIIILVFLLFYFFWYKKQQK